MTCPHEAWAKLRESGKGDGRLEIASYPAPVQTGYGPIRFALGSENEARILIPCASVQAGVRAESSVNLKLRVAEYRGPAGRQAYLDLICQDKSLEMVFSELASEIMRRVSIGTAPEQAVGGAIKDFKALFAAAVAGDVTRERVLGLVGELYMLQKFSEFSLSATEIWMGPWDQRHDFRSSFGALEVKTSGRSDTTRIRIHGEDQLLPPSGGELVLVQLRLEEVRGGELSVGRLYEILTKTLSSADRLDEGLALLGCEDPLSKIWNRYEFSLEAMHAWAIQDGFPRLTSREMTSGAFPAGVDTIEYTLDLSMAEQFRLDRQALKHYMKKMGND